MAGGKRGAKAKKKVRFRSYTFRISDTEKRRYDRLCAHEHIGFKQLIKKSLREYYKQADLPDPNEEDENQLDLFGSTDLFGHPVRLKRR